ncbi:uncharacterized protein [Triticum aestivum]|uniref:uncharacterized protein n=1 Tax=Triticum aestivum TaxID=4565 RepID=UPI001D033FD8|nr:uncharacterized protein LOC123191484 [Triticum aestivum]
MDREFSWNLLLNTGAECSALKIEEGVYVTFNVIDIHNILGTPIGGEIDIENTYAAPTSDQIKKIRGMLDLEDLPLYLTPADLRWALKKPCQNPFSEEDRVRTQIGFSMLCISTCFSPRDKRTTIPGEAYEICMDPSNLHKVNWGKYIDSELLRTATRCKKLLRERRTPHVYGCVLVLQALHFDSVDCSTFVNPDLSVRPRIRFFTAGNLGRLILGNTIPGTVPKQYGVMKARVVPTQNLPWDTTHVRRKIAEVNHNPPVYKLVLGLP